MNDIILDGDIEYLVQRLKKRNLEQVAIIDMFNLYDIETIEKVLDDNPDLKDLQFVLKLQEEEYKDSVKQRIKQMRLRSKEAFTVGEEFNFNTDDQEDNDKIDNEEGNKEENDKSEEPDQDNDYSNIPF